MRLLSFLGLVHVAVASSTIATFTDTKCQDSFRGFSGPNGYPNGTCAALNQDGAFSSFQIVGLDPGCTATIYHNVSSGDMCSGDPSAQITATIATCYDASWVWYSFDDCNVPGAAPTNTATPAASTSSPTGNSKLIGPIVGGVVGGVVVLVAFVVTLFMYMRRKKARAMESEIHVADSNPRHEMATDEVRGELDGGMGVKMYSELESPGVKKEPVELPAEYFAPVPRKQVAQDEINAVS